MSDALDKVADPMSYFTPSISAAAVTSLATMLGHFDIDPFRAAIVASAFAGALIFANKKELFTKLFYYPFIVATIFISATGMRETGLLLAEKGSPPAAEAAQPTPMPTPVPTPRQEYRPVLRSWR